MEVLSPGRWFLLCLLLLAPMAQAQEGLADDILALTDGKRVKIAWAQDPQGSGDAYVTEDVWQLLLYDTQDDTIRIIRSQLDSYARPLITHDGNRIVYTDVPDRNIYVIDSDGSNRRLVASGYAGALWYDSDSGTEWVYYQEGAGEGSDQPLRRINLDNGDQIELVWDQTDADLSWLSVSSDGRRVGGSWPWPESGVIVPDYDGSGGGDIYYTQNGYYQTGCWTCISPDDTYRYSVFPGTHREWISYAWPVGDPWIMSLVPPDPPMGAEDRVYSPKLSNHPDFLTLVAPAWVMEIEVQFGKTNPGFDQVTDWVRITDNNVWEAMPTAWIDPESVCIDSFEAAPATITAGGSSTLSWSTSWATGCTIEPGLGQVAPQGQQVVSPASTTTYTLTAEGNNGPVNRNVTVYVTVPDLDSIEITPRVGILLANESLAFTARAHDQAGAPIETVLDWQVSAGGSMHPASSGQPVAEHASDFESDGTPGEFEITVSSGDVSATARAFVWELGPLSLSINCGDSTPAVDGWTDEDPYRSGGISHDFTGPVDLNGQPDPAPEDLYLTCIHSDHSYSIPVPNGVYRVRLHFFDGNGDPQSMRYDIEGETVLENFDIATEAGGVNKVLIREFDAAVEDGNGLQIEAFVAGGDTVFESGFEIHSTDEQIPEVTITQPANGARVSGDVAVQGTASDDTAVRLVEVSVDGGPFEPATGTDAWSFTLVTATLADGQHTVTARATDGSGNQGTTSVVVDTFNDPSITILSPAGGEVWESGTVQTIEWTTQNLSEVDMMLSLDGGETFEPDKIVETIQDTDPQWGAFPWTVPDAETDRAVIMIKGYFGEVPTLSEPFTIAPPGDGQDLEGGCACGTTTRPSMLGLLPLLILFLFRSARLHTASPTEVVETVVRGNCKSNCDRVPTLQCPDSGHETN